MRRLAAAACGMALLVSACSSSNDSSKTTSGGSTVASIGTAASGGTAASSGTTASSDGTTPTADTASATTAPASPGQQLGINPCGVVTPAEVAAVFGGTVADGVVNADNGGCDYEISGTTNTGTVPIFAQISISYGNDYQSYDEVKAVFPDVVAIDGLGDGAWYYDAASQLHISTRGTELLISGLLPGDPAALQAEVVAFGKVLLAKLG